MCQERVLPVHQVRGDQPVAVREEGTQSKQGDLSQERQSLVDNGWTKDKMPVRMISKKKLRRGNVNKYGEKEIRNSIVTQEFSFCHNITFRHLIFILGSTPIQLLQV